MTNTTTITVEKLAPGARVLWRPESNDRPAPVTVETVTWVPTRVVRLLPKFPKDRQSRRTLQVVDHPTTGTYRVEFREGARAMLGVPAGSSFTVAAEVSA